MNEHTVSFADEHQHHEAAADHPIGHAAHGEHAGHEIMFRNRFWVCLVLTIPVLLFSPTIQEWLDFSMPAFPGSRWLLPIFAIVIFAYGGLPFLQMARWELKDRKPGMMTLIFLAISVAFIYSLATIVFDLGESFFWELVTLINVMLLGHWIEWRPPKTGGKLRLSSILRKSSR